MRFKSSIKFLIITILMLFYCSCTLPIEVVIPKENGVKISSTFKNLSGLSVDSKDNLYFVDNNVIKKLDSKNELTIIGGKEKPDIYPADGIIDGDFNTAKFGNVKNPIYLEKDNSIIFHDFYLNEKKQEIVFIRKLSFDNKVISLLENKYSFDNPYQLSRDSIFYYYPDSSGPQTIKSKKLDGTIIEYNFPYAKKIKYILSDSVNNLYLTCLEEDGGDIYRFYNNKWEKIISKSPNKSIFLDQEDNLYIKENFLTINIEGKITSGFYSPIILHKIPKEELKKSNLSIENNKYVIGELPDKYYYESSVFSSKSNTLFITNENSIYKINLKR